MNLLQKLKDDAAGLAILRDWLGEGGEPVPPETAEARSAVCVTCDQNHVVNYTKLKLTAAALIKHGLELKNDHSLTVSNEPELNVCQACCCVLSLKVWVPVNHIRAHTTDAQLAQLPPHCWMRKELLFHLLPP